MGREMNSAAYWLGKISSTFTLIGLLSCLGQVALADTRSMNTADEDRSSATSMANPMGMTNQGMTNQGMTDVNSGYATSTRAIAPSRGRERSDAEMPAFAAQVPLGKEDVGDFQRFVQMATGRQLKRFGQDLFREVSSTYAPVQNTPVTPDYLIGPGDELLIRAWGSINVEVRAPVDRNGQIYVPKVGAINVTGIRARDIEPYLKSRIGRVFRNFDLNVTMGQLRSMQIYVVGHARRPGTYTLSSLSTLVNALFASGGPNATGSMRHVQLKREWRGCRRSGPVRFHHQG